MRPKRWPASDRRVTLLGAEVPESSVTFHDDVVMDLPVASIATIEKLHHAILVDRSKLLRL